jgi:hypothetical protein
MHGWMQPLRCAPVQTDAADDLAHAGEQNVESRLRGTEYAANPSECRTPLSIR